MDIYNNGMMYMWDFIGHICKLAVRLKNIVHLKSMKILTILFLALILSSSKIYGQTRIVSGKIIDEHLEMLGGIRIQSSDSIVFGNTDFDGKFKIEIPSGETTLIVRGLGYESTIIKLPTSCNYIEIVVMTSIIYDYISAKKIERLRRKRFEKLSDIHQIAYEKGLFLNEKACFEREFTR